MQASNRAGASLRLKRLKNIGYEDMAGGAVFLAHIPWMNGFGPTKWAPECLGRLGHDSILDKCCTQRCTDFAQEAIIRKLARRTVILVLIPFVPALIAVGISLGIGNRSLLVAALLGIIISVLTVGLMMRLFPKTFNNDDELRR